MKTITKKIAAFINWIDDLLDNWQYEPQDINNMKSTKNERVIAKEEYPCLKTDGFGLVVLFTSQHTGTIVSGHAWDDLGEWDENWDADRFTTYHGTITLEN